MRIVLWSWISLAVLMGGCAHGPQGSAPNSASPAARPQQRCDAAAARWAVGKTNTVQHVEEARRRSGALMARILRPGQAATLEFDAERLNLQVDATGRITAASCG